MVNKYPLSSDDRSLSYHSSPSPTAVSPQSIQELKPTNDISMSVIVIGIFANGKV